MFQLVSKNKYCEFLNEEQRLRVMFVSPAIVRISYIEGESFVDKPSMIVNALTELDDFTVIDQRLEYIVKTERLQIIVSKETGAIRFKDGNGNLLHQEPSGGGKRLKRKKVYKYIYDNNMDDSVVSGIDGVKVDGEVTGRTFDREAFEYKLEFEFAEDEAIFGLGSHEEGYGNLRGKTRYLYQHNMKAVVPCFVSSKGYGLLFDCSSLMSFHDDDNGSYLWAETVDQMDYYFFTGEDASAITRNYYALTGIPPMLPRWAFGYIQSKERYFNSEEIVSVAREYRHRNIPLDVIVLDWKSWPDSSGWGQKTFDPMRFPDPAAFIEELHSMNVKLMVSIWPIMTGNCRNQTELYDQGLMLGNQATYNAFDDKGRKVYWQQVYDGLFCHGVDAWWCDCTEPFEADWEEVVKPAHSKRLKINTTQAKRYIDEGDILSYSLMHSKGIYEGQRSETNKKRVINLTRSSHAGQHRYATVSWSGDISATWQVLRNSIPEGVNFCATGEPYWTVDIGGFFIKSDPDHWFWSGDYEEGCRGLSPMEGPEPDPEDTGCTDLGYWELYTRWLQYGCFLPVFRSHGTDAPREIWRFGEKGELFYDIIAKYIRLRYKLMPYIYSVASEVGASGAAMMRPVAMQFPKDPATYDLIDQYLFGPSMMVCPVTSPMYYDRNSEQLTGVPKKRNVYLPDGSNWYDFWTEECHPGGITLEADAPLDVIPLFVSAGSILLLGQVTQHAAVASEGPLEVRIYSGANASFVWYEDSGDGYEYEDGQYSKVDFHWNEMTQTLQISERKGSFEGVIQKHKLILKLFLPDKNQEQTIDYKGDAVEILFSPASIIMPFENTDNNKLASK